MKYKSLFVTRETLTLQLPNLECRMSTSEDEILMADDDVDDTGDELDDPDYEEYALTFDLPGIVQGCTYQIFNLHFS